MGLEIWHLSWKLQVGSILSFIVDELNFTSYFDFTSYLSDTPELTIQYTWAEIFFC